MPTQGQKFRRGADEVMQGIYSFFCGISEFLMNISKRTYRNCAIIATGICVVSVVAFASNSFGGSGKNNCQRNGRAGFKNEASIVEDDEPGAVEMLKDIIENQPECLQAYFLQSDTVKISDYAIEYALALKEKASLTDTAKDTVMNAENITMAALEEPDEVKAELVEETVPETLAEERKADSIITTSGVAIEGVMNSPIEVTEEEYDILLHIVAAEAGCCDVYGQMLVANVVFNRVNDKHFPDTIKEVVFQKNQFSPATKGTIWKAKIRDTTIEAVDRVLAGEDYSCGATFFVARKYVSEKTFNRFNTKYEWIFEHDGHDFFRFR